MSYYQQCTTGTFLLCSIYVFILHAGQLATSKPASSNYLMSASSYSTFRHNLLQHLGGDHSISTELLQAAWPRSSTKSAWIRALENLHGFFFFFFLSFFSSSFFFRISLFFISSSSSRPYQYITVVFRNSLPSATEDTQEPRISQQLTSCWRKCTIQDVIVDETLTSKCCPLVFQFQQCYYGFRNRFKGENRLATMTNVIKNHLLHHMQRIFIIYWRIPMVSGRKKIRTNQNTFSCVFKIMRYTSQYI